MQQVTVCITKDFPQCRKVTEGVIGLRVLDSLCRTRQGMTLRSYGPSVVKVNPSFPRLLQQAGEGPLLPPAHTARQPINCFIH